MPGGGGIGLPLAPRSGGANASEEASASAAGASAGDEGASTGAAGASAGRAGAGAAAAGAWGGAMGAGRGAGASTTGGAGAGVGGGGASDGTSGRTGAGAALAAGRTGSSSTRRGGIGRSLPLEVTRRAGGRAGAGAGSGRDVGASTGAGAGRGAGAGAVSAGASGAAAFLVALAGLPGSSGWTSRTMPSRSALRRTRSAWASSMLEEWVLTPIPSVPQRSSVSLFVIPSSLASSCTRFFAAKFLVQSFRGSICGTRCGRGATARPSIFARTHGWARFGRAMSRRSARAFLTESQDRFG